MANEERILVVDDEIVIRELLHDILTGEGFVVELASNGRAALDMIRENSGFVVVFTDIMMPEMDGITLIREAHKFDPTIVPIVMTGYATLETARAAVKEGAYDYVLKPFNLSEVKLAVSNALERRRLINENTRLLEITELFKISESIASIREESRLLDFVLNAALDRVEAQRGSLMLVSQDGLNLEVVRSRGLPQQWHGSIIGIDKSISGLVAQQVQPLLISDIRNTPHLKGLSYHLPNDSFISVPLERKAVQVPQATISDDGQPRVIAVLNVTEKRGGLQFTESDLKTLSIVANHAAAALENVRLMRDIEDAQREIVFTLGEIVETRSRETGNHVKRVAAYSKLLAMKCNLSPAEAEILHLAAPLHDVGKVGIPDAVLNKPGSLTPEEYEVIKTHTHIGHDMLRVSRGRVLQSAALIALQHHERYDGKGYPHGLSGKNIHVFGRIVGIADVFDALGVERVYKAAWDFDRIINYFCEQRGHQFDPDLIDIFLNNVEEIVNIRNAFPEA
jgi:response regulator RpfG family c-di-GMP phosphodiesterase